MKVMCINEKWEREPNCEQAPHPSYGEICAVIKQKYVGQLVAYNLAEYHPELYWYDARAFVPLSDIDETVMVREKELTNA